MTDPVKAMTQDAKERTIKSLYHLGYSLEQIAKVSGLDLDRVVQLTKDIRRNERAG